MYQVTVAPFGEHGQHHIVVRLYASLQGENGTGFIHKK